MTDTDLGLGEFPHVATGPPTTPPPQPHAPERLGALDHATARLAALVESLDERTVRTPSMLPAWSRAHVVTHLARNADACLNLLLWARSGVEHPMYPSRADRDADIAEGAVRPCQVLLEDLRASAGRLSQAMRDLPVNAWDAEVAVHDTAIRARRIPWLRRREVLVHTVDLAAGVGFEHFAPAELADLADDVAEHYAGHPDVPPTAATAVFPGGARRVWHVGRSGTRADVHGSADAVVSWLTGRDEGEGLSGAVPVLPAWM